MTIKSTTIKTYTCDLCGGESAEKMAALLGEKHPGAMSYEEHPAVHVCGGCTDAPARAVLDLLYPPAVQRGWRRR
jgi:hypothetical protein